MQFVLFTRATRDDRMYISFEINGLHVDAKCGPVVFVLVFCSSSFMIYNMERGVTCHAVRDVILSDVPVQRIMN